MTPLVSIYITTNDRFELFKRALWSVLAQTYRNIEIVIVFDGGNNSSYEYAQKIKSDIPIILRRNSTPLGACASRNQAIQVSSGEFITGLDDDDFFRPDRISLFLEKWQELERRRVFFSALFDETTILKEHGPVKWVKKAVVNEIDISKRNEIGSQIFSRKNTFFKSGLFDESMPAWQDWDMWIRIVKSFGPIYNTGKSTYFQDESHSLPRISTSSEEKLRDAFFKFSNKHSSTKYKNQLDLIIALSNYPQAKLTLEELLLLLKNLQIRNLIRICINRKINF